MSPTDWLRQLISDHPTLLPATVTAVGVVAGVIQFISLARRDRKRRTLEVCERFILGADVADRWDRLELSFRQNSFPSDTDPPANPSLRLDVSRLLNHLETICTGARRGFYSRSLVKSYLKNYAVRLYDNFLRQEPPAELTSYFYDVPLVEVRRLFEWPEFVADPPLTAATRLAQRLRRGGGADANLEVDDSADRVAAYADAIDASRPREAARLKYLLKEAERRAASV